MQSGQSFIHCHSFVVSVRVCVSVCASLYTHTLLLLCKNVEANILCPRVGQKGCKFRLQLSRCAAAAAARRLRLRLRLAPFCILCVSKSFLHVCANPFNMAPTAGYLQQLLLLLLLHS